MNRARDRLGQVLIPAGVVAVIAVLNGYRLVAIVIGVSIVAIAVIVAGAPGSARGSSTSHLKIEHDRYTYVADWSVQGRPDLASLRHQLTELGLTVEDHSKALVVSRGSQFRTRLFGGYRVDPSVLPLSGRIEMVGGDFDLRYGVNLKLQDSLGPAVRDGRLAERYELSFLEIVARVRSAMQAKSSTGGA